MFEKRFKTPRIDQTYDHDVYTCGCINKHNIIVANKALFKTGLLNASQQINSLIRNFEQVKYTIVMGTVVGFPYSPPKSEPKEDIHLGDVDVGWAGPDKPSIVHIESGKHGPDKFDIISRFDQPFERFLTALTKLRANRIQHGDARFRESLDRCIVDKHQEFSQPKPETDVLFISTYEHPPRNANCSECDASKRVDRPRSLDAAEVSILVGRLPVEARSWNPANCVTDIGIFQKDL